MKRLFTFLFLLIATISYSQTNDFDIGYCITRPGNIELCYYWPPNNTTRNFEELSIVKIQGDTAKAYSFLQKAFKCNDSLYFLVLDIYELIKKNGITNNPTVKPIVTGTIQNYNNFHDLHVQLYPVTGSTTNRFINLYKNYVIRSTDTNNLIDAIGAYNLNGYILKSANQTLMTQYVKAYNDYVAIIQTKTYWGE